MDLREAVMNEMQKVAKQRDDLMNHPKIRPFIRSVEKWVQETQGRPISLYEKRNVAQCLYNSILDAGTRGSSRLFEATTEDSISFLGIQLPVISALIPSLVLNDVAIVQAIDRRIAAVFYLNVLYGTTKGGITSGNTMMSATTGHNTTQSGRRYAMARVDRETVGTGNATHTGTTSTATGLINLQNVIVETLVGSTYTRIATCTSAGVISGTGISGTINASGVYSITVSGVDSAATILLTYDYQYDLPEDANGNKDGVPETNIQVTQSAVTATDFPIRAKWSLGAQFDMNKAHGIDLESELVNFLGGEIRFTIDQYGLDQIDNAASGGWDPDSQANFSPATAPTTWDARPSEGETWFHKKVEFLDRVVEGSNNIFTKTKRATATFMHCGNNVARVITQLGKDYFTPVATPAEPTGPIKIGTLNVGAKALTVIQNPFKSTNYYTLGYRGKDYLHAGFIYCPYIPLFATPTLTTSDLMNQKGFMSSAAFKVTNAGMFCQGQIANLAGGYTIGS